MRAAVLMFVLAGCGASPRSIAVDGATYGDDLLKREAPVIEEKCVVELPELKEPEWSKRDGLCAVAVPANDLLAQAVIDTKELLRKPVAGAAELLELAGKLSLAAADFTAAMVKLAGGKP